MLSESLANLSPYLRIPLILCFAALAHLVVQGVRRLSVWFIDPALQPGPARKELLARQHPKVATVTSLATSAIAFTIYFFAIGLILKELGVSLTAYLATASVIGLAVGFGSQGLVQDVVIGLTLVFSDTFDIGDTVEVSGQIGRVEKIGLRFTTLVNFQGQSVFVPNRNIAVVGRYRKGAVRAYVDLQMPKEADEATVRETIEKIANGMRAQHPAVFLTEPEIFGVFESPGLGWRYLRLRFRIWPGQVALVESVFRQRTLASMREFEPDYADWMITVVYRIS